MVWLRPQVGTVMGTSGKTPQEEGNLDVLAWHMFSRKRNEVRRSYPESAPGIMVEFLAITF